MKVTQPENEFKQVTIVIETRDELIKLKQVLSEVVEGNCLSFEDEQIVAALANGLEDKF